MEQIYEGKQGDAIGGPAESVTLIDVARVAGVAPMTVSRALHRPELVRSATQKKVLDAVRATGYVPNMLAGGLASSKSRLVAVLLPTIASSVFADTVQALMDGLTAARYQTLLGLTGYSPQREEALARHLIKKGYRRFGVLSVNDSRALRRANSFIHELQRHDINSVPFEIRHAPATLQVGREGVSALLKGSAPEIVVCSSDTLAQGVLAEAASRGLKVPQDLAVMGFGDLNTAAHVYPALSTVRVDGAAIGARTALALLERFSNDNQGMRYPVRLDTGFAIIDRDSA